VSNRRDTSTRHRSFWLRNRRGGNEVGSRGAGAAVSSQRLAPRRAPQLTGGCRRPGSPVRPPRTRSGIWPSFARALISNGAPRCSPSSSISIDRIDPDPSSATDENNPSRRWPAVSLLATLKCAAASRVRTPTTLTRFGSYPSSRSSPTMASAFETRRMTSTRPFSPWPSAWVSTAGGEDGSRSTGAVPAPVIARSENPRSGIGSSGPLTVTASDSTGGAPLRDPAGSQLPVRSP